MAATDKHYRSPYALDVVFGVSCLLMLVTTFWMLYDDHARPYKKIQREFRDVEATLYQRAMLDRYPDSAEKIKEVRDAVAAAKKDVEEARKSVDADAAVRKLRLEKARLEADFQNEKATYDSEVSLRNILTDDADRAADGPKKTALLRERDQKVQLLARLDEKIKGIAAEIARKDEDLASALAGQRAAEAKLADAEKDYKKLLGEFDRAAKLASQKVWKTFDDGFRSLPIIDGFASSYKVQQVALSDLTIDYGGFRNVPRYDRCTTCHLGIDRPLFGKEDLRALKAPKKEGDPKRYEEAVKLLVERVKAGEDVGFKPGNLEDKLLSKDLTDAQVKQYCAHPRLDLFVDANSPHAAEKFGCTICHAGQGSATEFTLASHTPNDTPQSVEWKKKKGWEHNEYWEFPMLPNRFVESSCLKCHHQPTSLIRYGSREEAPKLLKGYNLVRENGCFGCHEISGMKAGVAVGPDLRLEPWPPLDVRSASERADALADKANPPGTLRKVGPSLRRLAEKVDDAWVRQWLDAPRGFRPDTRMPHFYHLKTNDGDALPEEQRAFPEAEIHAVAHYLMTESRRYAQKKDNTREGIARKLAAKPNEKETAELKRTLERLDAEQRPPLTPTSLVDGENKPVAKVPDATKDAAALAKGLNLFTEKGCLACHKHDGAAASGADVHFGPNLSRVAAKIKKENGRLWLIQWLLNPNVHFPRTRMPVTHLAVDDAALIADWLLSQPAADWEAKDIEAPKEETLTKLARIYLAKAPSVSPLKVDEILNKGLNEKDHIVAGLEMTADADERVLIGDTKPSADALKYYIGKKSVGRLGCFGCHDIPGFESAKPIGTPLNDWGRKDPARLAFEDAGAFLDAHFHIAKSRDNPEEWKFENGKPPVEEYFATPLMGHHGNRESFLHLKLMEPRAYDFHRDIKWDDRLRMPQFQFAPPPKQKEGENTDAYKARALKEEAEAREAVMTFVLGLVGEPVHAKYLYTPPPDRAAEVKGRAVLDKFNCAGCHQIQPGVYEVNLKDDEVLTAIKGAAGRVDRAKDYDDLRNHHAWSAERPQVGDKAIVYGIPPRKQNEDAPDQFALWLTRALRVKDKDGNDVEVRAGTPIGLPLKGFLTPPDQVAVYGGDFVNRLLPHVAAVAPDKKLPDDYKLKARDGDNDFGRASLPPPLVREGEKVQPDWLFRFLKDPTKIRPLVDRAVGLRMPKFNLSDEDAQALVNYFGGSDRTANPGIGLTYPYVPIPQRDDAYLSKKTADYVDLLKKEKKFDERLAAMKPAWEREVRERVALLDGQRKAAETLLAAAGADAEKKAVAQRAVDTVTKEYNDLKARLDKNDYEPERRRYETKEAYIVDAFRLLQHRDLCVKCHNVGTARAEDEKGPKLENVQDRMRPDWVERWVAFPNRVNTYSSPMPQNFTQNERKYQDVFVGSSRDQIDAVRDVLMNYTKVSQMPGSR